MYLNHADIVLLLDRLNADPEIAFLVATGIPEYDHSWIAVTRVEQLRDGCTMLWHVPSGDLPLLAKEFPDPPTIIPDPWQGWTEQRPGADPSFPFLGIHPGVVELDINRHGVTFDGRGKQPWSSLPRSADIIGMSSFGWVGPRYTMIGRSAPESTTRWWRRLRRWVNKNARRIPRSGTPDGPDAEIFAFPSAYAAIVQGKLRDDNPI